MFRTNNGCHTITPCGRLRAMTYEALHQQQSRFNKLYPKIDRPSICAGEAIAGAPAASFVLSAERTDVTGVAKLQRPVPLVRGSEHG